MGPFYSAAELWRHNFTDNAEGIQTTYVVIERRSDLRTYHQGKGLSNENYGGPKAFGRKFIEGAILYLVQNDEDRDAIQLLLDHLSLHFAYTRPDKQMISSRLFEL